MPLLLCLPQSSVLMTLVVLLDSTPTLHTFRVHPSVFVSGACESSRGAHKTGAQENISKPRNKVETERRQTNIAKPAASGIFSCSVCLCGVCMFACMLVCTWTHAQIWYVRDCWPTIELQFAQAHGMCSANGALNRLFRARLVLFLVASAESHCCGIYFVRAESKSVTPRMLNITVIGE